MKNPFTKIVLATFLLGGLAFRPGDVLTDLKLDSEQLGQQVFDQLTAERPVLGVPGESRNIARQFSAPMRVAAVRAMYAVVRAYVKSDDFLTRYDGWLRNKYQVEKGDEPPVTATFHEIKAAQEAQLTQITQAFSNMTPPMLALMLPQQMSEIQQQIRHADAPQKAALTRDLMVLRELQPLANTKPAEFKNRYLGFMKSTLARQMGQGAAEREESQVRDREIAEDYRRRLAEYQAHADPNLVVKKRLREFIALAESIDFDAETTKQGYKTEFVRADYRSQSREWKQLYRVGREPVQVARDLARAWLNEMK